MKYNIPISNKQIKDILVHPNLEYLGTGCQAIAYLHLPTNKVIKTIQVSGIEDPVLAFLRICINYPNNPFLPTVYNAKLYKTYMMYKDDRYEAFWNNCDIEDTPPDNALYTVIIIMEQLFPISTEDNEDLAIKLLQEINVLPQELEDLPTNIWGDYDPLYHTNHIFKYPIRRKDLRQDTNNQLFIKTLRLLEPLFDNFDPDLRRTNIMIRNPETNPHLVLVDPIC